MNMKHNTLFFKKIYTGLYNRMNSNRYENQ